MGVFFHADGLGLPTLFFDKVGDEVHHMYDLGFPQILVRVGTNVLVIQPGGDMGAVLILKAANPVRHFFIQAYHNTLGNIKGHGVITTHPVHIGRLDQEQHIHSFLRHSGFDFLNSLLILFFGKRQHR